MELNNLSESIIGAAMEVHRTLGPGLLESVYQKCMMHELNNREINAKQEVALPIVYKDMRIDGAYRADLVVDERVILELKAVDQVTPLHKSQLLSYLRLSSLKLGLIINFNVPVLKQGIRRVVNEF